MSHSPPDSEYDAVRTLLEARTGLSFRPDQKATTDDGIRRAMRRSGAGSSDEFLRRLQHDAQVLDHLVDELTVGETYFFREAAHYEFVRERILPDIQRRRGAEHTIRIWSAACASGEEAYSLAVVCDQMGLSDRVHVLGTDVSPAALAKARRAVYRPWSLRGEQAEQIKPYLQQVGAEEHQLAERIRRRVQFEFLNLALDVYPALANGTRGLDLIFCRNVLIYFNRQTIGDVFSRLYDSLAEGGWLITASCDPHADRHAAFESVVTEWGVFYRKPLRQAVPAGAAKSAAAPAIAPAIAPTSPAITPTAPAITPTAPAGTTAPHRSPRLPTDGSSRLPTRPAASPSDLLAGARRALDQGDYRRAADLTAGQLSDSAACAVHIQALANLDTLQALERCGEAAERHPLDAELHYLHAVILMGLNRDAEAAAAAQRAIFLNRELAIAQFTLGSLLRRRGALDAAWRAFRNARDLSRARPFDEPLPLAPEETAGRLADAAECQMRALAAAGGRRS